MNTNRDPIDPLILAEAVRMWLHDDNDPDEADADLHSILVNEGVLNPDEIVCAINADDTSILVILPEEIVTLTASGDVLTQAL